MPEKYLDAFHQGLPFHVLFFPARTNISRALTAVTDTTDQQQAVTNTNTFLMFESIGQGMLSFKALFKRIKAGMCRTHQVRHARDSGDQVIDFLHESHTTR